jgi:DNA-binding response OmpR family regulator
MRRVLLIDDDSTMHTIIKNVLDGDLTLVSCHTIKEADLVLSSEERPALVIIDRVLPDGDGLTICTKMRADDLLQDIPIIFFSSKTSESDKVCGLFAGADDYICKPISPLELKARIHARIRVNSKKIFLAGLAIDLSNHSTHIKSNGLTKEIELTRIEFKMLITLVQSPDRVFSRDLLITIVWGQTSNLSDRVIDTHMSHLRRKIAGSGVSIKSSRGEGYKLVVDKTAPQAA